MTNKNNIDCAKIAFNAVINDKNNNPAKAAFLEVSKALFNSKFNNDSQEVKNSLKGYMAAMEYLKKNN